jgi:hypothetical protein
MTSPTLPAAITSDGNWKVWYATAVADPNNPTVAELTALTGFDATCYLTGDGWNPTTDEQVVTDDRACSRQTFEDLGRYTDKLQVKYIYRQQEPTSATNKAYNVWKRGVTGFLFYRGGTDFAPDIAAGDIGDLIPVVFDVQQKVPATGNEQLQIMQNVRVTGPVIRDVVVVA